VLTYAPDADPTSPGVIVAGAGLRPTVNGYANYPLLSHYAPTGGWAITPAPVSGLYAHQFQASARLLVVGSFTKLYQLTRAADGSFATADVSTGGDAYPAFATATGDEGHARYVSFASFGDVALASYRNMGGLYRQATSGALFAQVAGAPECGVLANFRNFIIGGDVGDYGSTTGEPDMLAWSAFGNYTSWTPDTSSQAGNARLTDVSGRIVALMPIGDALAVYKANAIWLMRYLLDGQGNVWNFKLTSAAIGCNADVTKPPPIVNLGTAHLFVGAEDIYIFDGMQTRPIASGVVRDYLHANFYDATHGRLRGTRVSHDMRAGEVAFWDYGLTYSYRLGKWGALPAGEVGQIVATCVAYGQTLDFGAGGVINDAPMLVVQTDGTLYNRYKYANDATPIVYAPMTMTTGDTGDNGEPSLLAHVAPLWRSPPATTPTLDYSYRHALGGALAADGAGTWDSDRLRFDIGKNYAWHRVTINVPPGESQSVELTGVQYSLRKGGKTVVFPLVGR
jgi:hypothetical protein